jgi:hypothetical protein
MVMSKRKEASARRHSSHRSAEMPDSATFEGDIRSFVVAVELALAADQRPDLAQSIRDLTERFPDVIDTSTFAALAALADRIDTSALDKIAAQIDTSVLDKIAAQIDTSVFDELAQRVDTSTFDRLARSIDASMLQGLEPAVNEMAVSSLSDFDLHILRAAAAFHDAAYPPHASRLAEVAALRNRLVHFGTLVDLGGSIRLEQIRSLVEGAYASGLDSDWGAVGSLLWSSLEKAAADEPSTTNEESRSEA